MQQLFYFSDLIAISNVMCFARVCVCACVYVSVCVCIPCVQRLVRFRGFAARLVRFF